MPRERITSTTEEADSAFERGGAIISRAEKFKGSKAFQALGSQDQQTLESYWMAIARGVVRKDSPLYREALAELEKFLDLVETQ